MPESAPLHICPRCGYDVSGVVPRWTESCPLHGTCSECGLVYEWVDIFRPERIYPTWSFEHTKRRRFLAFFQTILRTLRPRALWTQIRLAAPVRLWRLAILAMLVVITAHLAAVGIATKVYQPDLWQTAWRTIGGKPVLTRVFIWDAFWPIAAWPYSHEWYRLIGPLGLLLLIWGLLAPLPFLLLEQTMATSKVRRVHLLRGWVYFLVVLCLLIIGDMLMMFLPLSLTRGLFGGAASAWWWNTGWASRLMQFLWATLGVLLFLAVGAWLVRWWWLFTSVYLKLPHAKSVVAAMLTIALLASTGICLIIDPELRYAIGTALNSVLGWNAY